MRVRGIVLSCNAVPGLGGGSGAERGSASVAKTFPSGEIIVTYFHFRQHNVTQTCLPISCCFFIKHIKHRWKESKQKMCKELQANDGT